MMRKDELIFCLWLLISTAVAVVPPVLAGGAA